MAKTSQTTWLSMCLSLVWHCAQVSFSTRTGLISTYSTIPYCWHDRASTARKQYSTVPGTVQYNDQQMTAICRFYFIVRLVPSCTAYSTVVAPGIRLTLRGNDRLKFLIMPLHSNLERFSISPAYRQVHETEQSSTNILGEIPYPYPSVLAR